LGTLYAGRRIPLGRTAKKKENCREKNSFSQWKKKEIEKLLRKEGEI